MKAYVAVSYHKRQSLREALNAIATTLRDFKIEPLVFVDNYKFTAAEEKLMMQRAMADIDICDILIAETTDKGVGIGIEVGYAKAKNKPIIYLRHKQAKHSTTVSGISDFQIIYSDCNDLKLQLQKLLITIL